MIVKDRRNLCLRNGRIFPVVVIPDGYNVLDEFVTVKLSYDLEKRLNEAGRFGDSSSSRYFYAVRASFDDRRNVCVGSDLNIGGDNATACLDKNKSDNYLAEEIEKYATNLVNRVYQTLKIRVPITELVFPMHSQ